ncbi:MAG: GNAT family N-acetyltransferase [Anaerolineae bacterium]|nr:GNAT family N-acetyltransferase [Anaerolineae bacterium]
MFIRSAVLHDLNDCFNLDSSYETACVWQLEQREDEMGISVALRKVYLPRPMQASYPAPGGELLNRWDQGGCVLVAEVDGQVRGYVDVGVQRDQHLAWVHNLVVDRPYRRRGLGTALLREAMRWGQQRAVRRMMFAVQSKNDPAIRFCHHLGCRFCGFNDRYFANRDIALFFVCGVM